MEQNVDMARMRRIARAKARRMGSLDDARALAEDMEAAGWIRWLESKRSGELRWYDAIKGMRDCWSQWRFGISCRSRAQMRVGEREEAMQGVDFEEIESPQPSIESQVFTCEVLRLIEADLTRDKRSKGMSTFMALLLNGGPLANGEARRLGLAESDNRMRHRRRIKEILTKILEEEPYEKTDRIFAHSTAA